ncbi:MAG: hypothetical protein HUJ94_00765 [Bacteroidales bacterium]|nr:hypothetical protein [Bacteroidales bacterium]
MKRLLITLALLTACLAVLAQDGLDREWTLYLVHHSHTDIGYTRPQHEIIAEHMRYIDYAIDYCDRTKDYPDNCRFRWTCESAWIAAEYLKTRPAEQVARFKDCVRRGQMEVTAMAFNMADVADENSLRYFLQPLKTIREHGIPVTVAMQNDVNGIAWCMTDFLHDLGVRYLWMGENIHKSYAPFDKPTVFNWESPSGNSLMAYRSEIYVTGIWWGIPFADEKKVEQNAVGFLKSLEDRGYPFDAFGVQFGGADTDNAPPTDRVSDFVKQWNETHDKIKLRFALAHEFFEYMEKQDKDLIATHRVAWPDWWTDGFGSAARETSVARKTHSDIISAQGLLSMAELMGADVSQETEDVIPKVNDNLVLYDEHTFGAAESIWDPTCWNSQIQFQSKGAFAWTAQRDARLLMETAGGYLQSFIARGERPTLTLFNPLAWERDSYAEIYIDEVVVPRGHDFRIVDGEGNEVAHQYLRSRNEGSFYALYAKNVPAMGYRTYDIYVDEPQSAKAAAPTEDRFVMENDWYKVRIDEQKACISSIIDKRTGRELVDDEAEWGFGSLLYETLEDRWQLVKTDSQGLRRFGLTDLRYDDVRYGPLYRIFTLHGRLDGLDHRGAWIEFRLYENSPRIELLYALRRLPEENPSSLYVAMPFAGGSDCLSFDAQGGIIHPGVNQLEGSSSEWSTLQNFAKVDNGDSQTLMVSQEMPVVMFGRLLDGPFQYIKSYEHPYMYSWVMNNYWTTNFLASQGGEICFTYDITTLEGNSDADALRYSVGRRTPVYGRVMPASGSNANGKLSRRARSSRSLLSCSNRNVVLLNVAPSVYDSGLVLQVREMSGEAQQFSILDEKGRRIRCRVVNAIEEPLSRRKARQSIAANGDIFISIAR